MPDWFGCCGTVDAGVGDTQPCMWATAAGPPVIPVAGRPDTWLFACARTYQRADGIRAETEAQSKLAALLADDYPAVGGGRPAAELLSTTAVAHRGAFLIKVCRRHRRRRRRRRSRSRSRTSQLQAVCLSS